MPVSPPILAGSASALFGLTVAALALWLLAASQSRAEWLERRILGPGGRAGAESGSRTRGRDQALLPRLPAWALYAWSVWLGGTLAGGPGLGAGLTLVAGLLGLVQGIMAARARQHALAVGVQAFVRDLHLLASAGETADRCLLSAVSRCSEPLRDALRPASLGIQAGQSIHEAMSGVGLAAEVPEYMGLVQALWLHGETGASLSSLLAESADRADEAALLRSETDSKLGEARSTARTLATVPVAVAGYLMAFNRSTLAPMLQDPAGQLALVLGACLWLAGVIVVSKMQAPPADLGGEA